MSVVAGLVGLGLITIVGDLGGRMVFGHGVGVATRAEFETVSGSNDADVGADNPGAILGHALTAVSGDFANAILPADSTILSMYLQRDDLVLVTDESFVSVQGEIEINLDRFKGRTSVLYNFVSEDETSYIELGGGTVEQGRKSSGGSKTFDTAIMTPSGWFTITAVSDGSHFRGYVNGAMIVHGHGDAPPEGSIGLGLKGSGVVMVRRLDVERLR